MNRDQHPTPPPLDDVELAEMSARKLETSVLTEPLKDLIDRFHKQERLEKENEALRRIIDRAYKRLKSIADALGGDSLVLLDAKARNLRGELTLAQTTNRALLLENTELVATNRELKRQIETLVRENETLARQVPPPPPASVFDGPKGIEMYRAAEENDNIKKLPIPGWYRVEKLDTKKHEVFTYAGTKAGYIVACNLYQNNITGAITATPMKYTDVLELP